MKYKISSWIVVLLVILFLSPVGIAGSKKWGKNLIPNSDFKLHKNKPAGWQVNSKNNSSKTAIQFIRQNKDHNILAFHPNHASNMVVSRTLAIKKLAGKTVRLQALISFGDISKSTGSQLYLRIRQYSKGKFIADACRIWCILNGNQLRVVQWENGRPNTTKIIKDVQGKTITVSSTGKLASIDGYQQVFIAAWPTKHNVDKGNGIIRVNSISLRQKLLPPISLKNVPPTITKSKDKLAFDVEVNPDITVSKKHPLHLETTLARYRNDTLLYQVSEKYLMATPSQHVSIPINNLPAGDYRLIVKLYNSSNKLIANQTRSIQLINGPFG